MPSKESTKGYLLHQFDRVLKRWKKIGHMYKDWNEAKHHLSNFEQNDKFLGIINNYRIVVISL